MKNNDIGLLLVRISIGYTMLIYGITKITSGIDYIKSMLAQMGIPEILGNGVFIGEIIAPICIIIGFRTRLSGLIFSINCIVALLLVQLPNIFKLNPFGGWELGLLFIYIFASLALYFTGAGKYAVSKKSKWD